METDALCIYSDDGCSLALFPFSSFSLSFLSFSEIYNNPYSLFVKSRMLFNLKHKTLFFTKSVPLCKNKKITNGGDRELKQNFSRDAFQIDKSSFVKKKKKDS